MVDLALQNARLQEQHAVGEMYLNDQDRRVETAEDSTHVYRSDHPSFVRVIRSISSPHHSS